MNRVELIQSLMKQKCLANYLEIGVFNGHVLFRIKSTFKIAVDPEFTFDAVRKIGKTFINPYNLFNKYFSKTSDDFFKEDAQDIFAQKKVEIALVDGMHEYEYALRDVKIFCIIWMKEELLLCTIVILLPGKQHVLIRNGKQRVNPGNGTAMYGKPLCIYALFEKILMFLCWIAIMGLVLLPKENLKII